MSGSERDARRSGPAEEVTVGRGIHHQKKSAHNRTLFKNFFQTRDRGSNRLPIEAGDRFGFDQFPGLIEMVVDDCVWIDTNRMVNGR